MRIPTKSADGTPNGFVLPIWNALESPELRPEQIYITAVLPGCMKGPHLHKKRRGLFYCVVGKVRIVWRSVDCCVGNCYSACDLEPSGRLCTVEPGTPVAIYSMSREESLVLNMPSPAWSRDDQDDWPVSDWNYDLQSELARETHGGFKPPIAPSPRAEQGFEVWL